MNTSYDLYVACKYIDKRGSDSRTVQKIRNVAEADIIPEATKALSMWTQIERGKKQPDGMRFVRCTVEAYKNEGDTGRTVQLFSWTDAEHDRDY